MQLMGGSSLLAKAQTALQAAAAKADRALTEFKADLKADFKGTTDSLKGSNDGKRGQQQQQLLLPPAIIKVLESENSIDVSAMGKINSNDNNNNNNNDSDKKSNDGSFCQRILPRKPASLVSGDSEVEKSSSEGGFRQRILLRKSADKDLQSAIAVIEGDDDLKAQDFWKRYFSSTLKNIKQDLLDRDSEVRVSGDSVVSSVDLSSSCADSPKKDPIEEEDYKRAFSVVSIPPSSLLRRLAAFAENGKSAKTQKNGSQRRSLDRESPSTSGEWTGLVTGLAMVRKLSQKDGKFRGNGGSNRGRHHALMWALFEVDNDLDIKEVAGEESSVSPPKKMRLPQEILGAPPDSFVAKLAELMGGMKSEQRMAEFWMEVVAELRRRWFTGEPIPRMPVDASPDLHYCSLHQQLQLINCCIARRKRRASILASLPEAQLRGFEQWDDSQMSLETSGSPPAAAGDMSPTQSQSTELCAKLKDGRLVLRLGADYPADGLRMLETGEPIYSPLTQESPLFTEDSIREAEELVLRTGSVGAGCSHLLSDMQAFKAANPGCILEDFVRWYSPPDWREDPESGLNQGTISEDSNGETGMEATGTEARGYLSARMQCKGNLWQELWASARPIPAVRQSPLFDEELAGESTLDALENLPPCELYKQLFTAAFSVGYAIAEGSEAAKQDPLMTCLREFSDFITYSCGRDMNGATLDSMCEAYEALEAAILVPPDEVPETQGRQWLASLKAFRGAEKS
ncbi:unnamed protein product [Calypogeia fissa]